MSDLRFYGLGLLLAGKGLDLLTTAALLPLAGIVESNPIPASLYASNGVVGLTALAVVAVLLVVGMTESGAWYARSNGELRSEQLMYILGYWSLGAFWSVIGFWNVFQAYPYVLSV